MAITTYSDELATPLSAIERAWTWISARVSAVSKSIQMSQMLRVLSQLDDRQLEQIGITRTEIPLHAREIVYGNG